MDTIFAVSSGTPPAGIAVLRISGPAAFDIPRTLAGRLPEERRATLLTLRDPADGTTLDRALVLAFAAPATATGEDMVELHLHGGRAVVAAVERCLATLGPRRADPGEFTRRALTNGKIDLTEAEGLGDLLAAETESQRRVAMTAADGGIRRKITEWSNALLALSAQVEAELDFSDEDDVHDTSMEQIRGHAVRLAQALNRVLDQPPVERLHDGIRIVLAGPPNSGKSSLFNAMVDRDAAIVSPIAGTTRDRIEASVQRNGMAYLITDTAGLAAVTDDPIERIGIDRARAAISVADLVLWLGDETPPVGALWVHPRADLPGRASLPTGRSVAVSTMSGHGLTALWSLIEDRAAALVPSLDTIVLNARQRTLVGEACDAIDRSGRLNDMLLLAEELRQARLALDRVTGHTGTEAMLDALFGKFCIGK